MSLASFAGIAIYLGRYAIKQTRDWNFDDHFGEVLREGDMNKRAEKKVRFRYRFSWNWKH